MDDWAASSDEDDDGDIDDEDDGGTILNTLLKIYFKLMFTWARLFKTSLALRCH